MADLVLLLFILTMALWGAKSGFIKTIFHFGYYIISAAVAMYLYPVLANVMTDSGFSDFIHDKVIMPRIGVNPESVALPAFMGNAVQKGIESTTESIAASLTTVILNVICFVGVLLIVKIGLKIVVSLLDKVARLPILSTFNRFGGFVAGAVNGILASYIILAVISIFATGKITEIIETSKYVSYMYDNNLIFKIILR